MMSYAYSGAALSPSPSVGAARVAQTHSIYLKCVGASATPTVLGTATPTPTHTVSPTCPPTSSRTCTSYPSWTPTLSPTPYACPLTQGYPLIGSTTGSAATNLKSFGFT